MTVPALTWLPLLGVVKSGRTLTRSPAVTSVRLAATDFWYVVEPVMLTFTDPAFVVIVITLGAST